MNNNLYIVIVTYNGMQWLDKCLKSCVSYPVIIVDNASTDETIPFIETNYPNVTLFKQDKNLGFGQANNLGIKYALDQGAEHVFLLNQDAYIIKDALDDLVAFQKERPEYGILSPIHITGDQKKLDKNFSYFMLKEYTGQFYSDFVLGNKLHDVYEVPFINAAAWLISKKCLETVGGFDPLFFHYGEDDNYCQRVLYHNLKIGVLANVYVIHDRSDRKREMVVEFSDIYYINKLRKFKIKYSNILTNFDMLYDIRKLKKNILKLQLKGRFGRARQHKKTLRLVLKTMDNIDKSRTLNVIKGPHYLE
ncbi:glycosyltransferase family 2 protein [Winogradskyella helgolandensis]|uniref:glycosyltransferase family 2 protein n=1 Tax=Winogradskyella helgolandensis TaxID=2697010 RepID=UPI0015BAD4A6|nr:glycosyltransferase family 2 protein [Winogradskyella helgolandensis]